MYFWEDFKDVHSKLADFGIRTLEQRKDVSDQLLYFFEVHVNSRKDVAFAFQKK
jgi:hypothetical protein